MENLQWSQARYQPRHLQLSRLCRHHPGPAWHADFQQQQATSAEVTIANITCIDAEPIRYGVDQAVGTNQVIAYRLVLIDSRYAFVEPRGGRLCVGFVNPSTVLPPDADRTHVPMTRTMNQCISPCLTAMGITASVPSLSGINPPQDLKWFGTHAPASWKNCCR